MPALVRFVPPLLPPFLRVLLALVVLAPRAEAQSPTIKFSGATGVAPYFSMTTSDDTLTIVVSLCSDYSIVDYFGYLNQGNGNGMYVDFIEDATADCPGSGTGYHVTLPMGIAGTNTLTVSMTDVMDQSVDAWLYVNYIPPARAAVMTSAIGGVRLMPGEQVVVPFTVANAGSSSANFMATVSCTGGFTGCVETISSSTSFQTGTLAPGAIFSREITVTAGASAGSGSVRLIADAYPTGGIADTAYVSLANVAPPAPAPVVTAGRATMTAAASAVYPLYFTIRNPDPFQARTVTPSVVCLHGIGCTMSTTPFSLGAGQDTTVVVQATWPGGTLPGGSTVTVTASVSGPTGSGNAATTLTTGANPSATLTLGVASLNPGTSIARDQCLSIAAGGAGGIECGALRAGHGVQGIRTMDVVRSPTLLYLSDHAHPVVRVAADFSAQNLQTTDSLRVNMTVTGVGAIGERKLRWVPECGRSTGCRLVYPVNAVTHALATGVYDYTLEVRVGAAGPTQQASGSFVVVNDRTSPFGSGWWMEGLERLFTVSATQMLWVGGDGSTRVYVKQHDSLYTVQSLVNRPDTLTKVGANWNRRLRNGGVVEFDAQRRHVSTTNRQGYVTSMRYNGAATVPDSLVLPVISGSTAKRAFRFTWNTDSSVTRLATIVGQSGSLGALTTTVTTGANRLLTRIVDPSGDSVRFAYASSSLPLMTRRFDRLRDSTSFAYDSAYTVRTVTVHMGAAAAIVTTVCTAEGRTLVACGSDGTGVEPASAHRVRTLLDGPRTDLTDLTAFYVGRFGAPDTIVNALGVRTRLERAHGTFPALVTKLTDAAGLVTNTTYTARGLPDEVTVVAPYGGSNAVTSYTWHSKWDMVTEIESPTGEVQRFGYSSTTGNRTWQQRGADDSTRVLFTYSHNLLKTVTPPGAPSDSLFYSTSTGNLRRLRSALGFVTDIVRDSIGREVLVRTPTDSAQTSAFRTEQRFVYDLAGRVVRQETIAAKQVWNRTFGSASLIDSVAARTAVVKTTYDPEGRPLTVQRFTLPDSSSNASSTTAMRYDIAGRLRAQEELHTTGPDSNLYDPAGNVVRTITRRGHHLQQFYDALGRVTARLTPGVTYSQQTCLDCHVIQPHPYMLDTIKAPYYGTRVANGLTNPDVLIPTTVSYFAFDAAGRMVQADNGEAQIRRGYHPNGALKADTTWLRGYDVAALAFSTDWRTVLAYTYDLSGRRLTRSDQTGGHQTYTYDALGQLAATTDSAGPGAAAVAVTFAYDASGRLLSQAVPAAGTVATWTYDGAGQPRTRTEEGFADTLGYDARGKRVAVAGKATMTSIHTIYGLYGFDGHGQLAASVTDGDGVLALERLALDGHQNVRIRHANRLQGPTAERLDTSVFVGSQLRSRLGTHFPEGRTGVGGVGAAVPIVDSLALVYDVAGNVIRQTVIKVEWVGNIGTGYPIRHASGHAWSWSFYDAAQQLRYAQRTTFEESPTTQYDEYWYDALGRRVAVRTRADSTTCAASDVTTPAHCRQQFLRVTWDGDQILGEERRRGSWHYYPGGVGTGGNSPWYGVVRYTQTGAIDAPLLLWVDGESPRVLHRNWRGNVAGATFVATDAADTETTWPAAISDVFYAPDAQLAAPPANKWLGSLVEDSKDATGTLYRRHRYYDPVSGRFTQEDPIGLAGGMNLYGYANADPINNSDPFGLCTPSPECFLQAAANWGAKRGGALGAAVLNAAAVANGIAEATQVNALGRAIDDADAGAAVGALAGALPVGKLGKGSALIRDALDNPGNWKVVGAFAEAATNRRARGGVSIQTIVQNADGDQLVRHTVVNRAGDVIDDHFRPMFKP